jgi:Bacterial Ig-like domain (group 1)
MLAGEAVGTPSASASLVTLESAVVPFNNVSAELRLAPATQVFDLDPSIPADGLTQAVVVVQLLDANGNFVSGKNVTLAASGGNPQISGSATTTVDNGAAVFTVTDLSPETVILTATDTTDNIQLAQTASITFVPPPATTIGISAFPASPTSVPNDGASAATITVTLSDALNRRVPGKEVRLTQVTGPFDLFSGHSAISGPTPALTNANGQIVFTAVNNKNETVKYKAVDVTDGDLVSSGVATVKFGSGVFNQSECGNGNPVPARDFAITPFATGFSSGNTSLDVSTSPQTVQRIDFNGCPGAYGMAFDQAGYLYVAHLPTGEIYKFGPNGGVADSSTRVTTTPIGVGLGGIAFDAGGNLFATRFGIENSGMHSGVIYRLNPSTGAVIATVASGLTCPSGVGVDPLSGDLFTSGACRSLIDNSVNRQELWRTSNPLSGSPLTTVHTMLPRYFNVGPVFGSNGTMYVWNDLLFPTASLYQVSATTTPAPTVTTLSGVVPTNGVMIPLGVQADGAAESLIFGTVVDGKDSLAMLDLTTSPPSVSRVLSSGMTPPFVNAVQGPDGCVYWGQGNAVFKVTNAAGACDYASPTQPPTILLSPTVVSPNPPLGTPETFVATFHHASVPEDTPVFFTVRGTNFESAMVRTDADGQASFTYTGAVVGTDSVRVTATLGTETYASNVTQVTWGTGKNTTICAVSPYGRRCYRDTD